MSIFFLLILNFLGNQKDKNDPKKYFVALLLFGFLLQQIMLIYYMNGSIKK